MTIYKWLYKMLKDSISEFTFLCYSFTNNIFDTQVYNYMQSTVKIE